MEVSSIFDCADRNGKTRRDPTESIETPTNLDGSQLHLQRDGRLERAELGVAEQRVQHAPIPAAEGRDAQRRHKRFWQLQRTEVCQSCSSDATCRATRMCLLMRQRPPKQLPSNLQAQLKTKRYLVLARGVQQCVPAIVH